MDGPRSAGPGAPGPFSPGRFSLGPFSLRPPGPAELAAVLDRAAGEEPSYPEVGATQDPGAPLPAGYHHLRIAVTLGHGRETFDRACAALRAWAPQRGAGIELLPAAPPLQAGQDLVLAFRAFPFYVTAAARIVWVVDTRDRFGFGYGTLPRHPERGEEAFVVERQAGADAGTVAFTIRAFSRPGHPITRLGAPVGQAIQHRVTGRYLAAMRQAAAPEAPGA
jgi:uncharacterized protein (UPF0548 family)